MHALVANVVRDASDDEFAGGPAEAMQSEDWAAQVRQRALHGGSRRPPTPRLVARAALTLGVLAHLIFFVCLYFEMRPHPVEDRNVLHVRLIDSPPRLAAPTTATLSTNPPPLLARRPAVSPNLTASRLRSATPPTASLQHPRTAATTRPKAPGEAAAREPHYTAYNPDGSLNIPKDLLEQIDAAKPKPDFIVKSTAPSPIMMSHRPLKIRPNHFDAEWRGNGTLLDDFVDRYLTTETKEFTMPWGTKVKCKGIALISIIGMCGFGFPPPDVGPTEKWKPASVLDEY